MTKGVKILVVIMITVAIALTSFFVMKKAYDESQKEIEEENKKAEESISNLTVIDVSKMKELFSSNDTKIIFVGSLTCPHCTAIKPVINSVVKDLNVTVYYLELSTMTDEENNEYYKQHSAFFREYLYTEPVFIYSNRYVYEDTEYT